MVENLNRTDITVYSERDEIVWDDLVKCVFACQTVNLLACRYT